MNIRIVPDSRKRKTVVLIILTIFLLTVLGLDRLYISRFNDHYLYSERVVISEGGTPVDDGNNIVACSHPAITVDKNGEIYVVWTDSRTVDNQTPSFEGKPPCFNVYFSKSDDGGQTFSKNICVNDYKKHITHTRPNLITDDKGNIYVAWIEYNVDANIIIDSDIFMAISHDKGETFSDPIQVDNDGIYVFTLSKPAMVADRDGTIHFSFSGIPIEVQDTPHLFGGDIFYTSYYPITQTFSPLIRINDDGESIKNSQTCPAIAVDDGGNVYFAWRDNRDGDNQSVYYTMLENETHIVRKNLRIGGELIFDKNGPAIAVHNNHVYIFWRNDRGKFSIAFARSVDGGKSFSPWRSINHENSALYCAFIGNPNSIVSDNGTLYVSWNAGSPSYGQFYPIGIFFTSSIDNGETFHDEHELGNYRITSRWRGNKDVYPQSEQSMYYHNGTFYFAYVEKRLDYYDGSLEHGYFSLSGISFQKYPLKNGL